MNDIPTDFVSEMRQIKSNDVKANGQAGWKLLTDQGYEVHTGLTPDYSEEIRKMSQEPAIREYCPKDSTERFEDKASTRKWLSKGRAIFLLLKDDRLIGYGWTGHATSDNVPGGQTTFALRIGQTGHGQGLAAPFSWVTIGASHVLYSLQDFWLETWASNGAAVHIYHKLGFEDVTAKPSKRSTTEGSDVDDIRVFMQLPNQLLASS